MRPHRFIDFAALKAAVKLEAVLQRFGLLDSFKRGPDSLSGCCPLHQGTNPTQFRVSLSKNCWNCFGDCQGGGNVLDFVEKMERCTPIEAANRLVAWFQLDIARINGDSPKPRTTDRAQAPSDGAAPTPPKPQPAPSAPSPVPIVPARPVPTSEDAGAANRPLHFTLADKLDYQHPYLAERELAPETIAEFGIGFCNAGSMTGRVCIPVHNARGELVGYAGRWPGTPPSKETPKYKLPKGFKKSAELFNLHRALKEPPDAPLYLVEGFFDVMRLWQLGLKKVVALMGSTMSEGQEKLLFEAAPFPPRIIVLLDADEAGRTGADDLVRRLSRRTFVRRLDLPEAKPQPEHLLAADITSFPHALNENA